MNNTASNTLVMVALFIAASFALYHARRVFLPQPVDPPAPTADAGVIQQFQRRRRLAFAAMAFVVSMFGYLFLLQAIRRPGGVLIGLSYKTHVILAFAGMAAGIAVAAFGYRCPVCGEPPFDSAGGRTMVDLDPTTCPTCGTPLK